VRTLPKQGFHLYPRLCCPLCSFFTTAPEKLGIHLVDKHPKEVVKGFLKIKTPPKKTRK